MAFVVAGAFALGGVEAWIGGDRVGAEEAHWIWLRGNWRRPVPVAFLAATDLWLDEVPAEAVLRLVGDEEAEAFVNGWRVGGSRYRAGEGAVGFRVAPFLRAGGNRLVIEARSTRGGGGLLAWIESGDAGDGGDAAERRWAPTGPGWRMFRAPSPALLGGLLPLADGEPPLDLGAPPRGRWGRVAAGPVREGPDPGTLRPAAVAPARGRSLMPPSPWHAAWATRTFSPALWGATLLDWGRVQEGQLELRFGAGDLGEGLLFLSTDAPPDPRRAADALVVVGPGFESWRDVESRRFRYALVIASRRPVEARLLAAPGLPLARPAVARGLLGITPPPLRAPMEDKLRRDFQGLALLGGGEGF